MMQEGRELTIQRKKTQPEGTRWKKKLFLTIQQLNVSYINVSLMECFHIFRLSRRYSTFEELYSIRV
jgi:hypothetical protein